MRNVWTDLAITIQKYIVNGGGERVRGREIEKGYACVLCACVCERVSVRENE